MTRTPTTLRPVLQLVDELSVPGLDPCEEEILRQAQDAHPALPAPMATTTFAAWARAARRAS